jgi:hypothetical protein
MTEEQGKGCEHVCISVAKLAAWRKQQAGAVRGLRSSSRYWQTHKSMVQGFHVADIDAHVPWPWQDKIRTQSLILGSNRSNVGAVTLEMGYPERSGGSGGGTLETTVGEINNRIAELIQL